MSILFLFREELPPLAELSDLSTEWVESEDKAILDKSVDATEILSTVSEPRTSHSKVSQNFPR